MSRKRAQDEYKQTSTTYPVYDFYTAGEELSNTLTHGIGLALSILGFFFFVSVPEQLAHQVAFGIYGAGVLLSYLTSTLYHGASQGWQKHRLRLLDHATIYLNIAGTYTPYLALIGRSWLSTAMLAVIWLIALAGVGFKLFVPDLDRFESYSVLSYLAMGWIFPLFVFDIYPNMPNYTFELLIAGGLTYTIGIFFYRWEALPHNHAIWHIFVMAAAGCHYWAAYRLYLALAYAA